MLTAFWMLLLFMTLLAFGVMLRFPRTQILQLWSRRRSAQHKTSRSNMNLPDHRLMLRYPSRNVTCSDLKGFREIDFIMTLHILKLNYKKKKLLILTFL